MLFSFYKHHTRKKMRNTAISYLRLSGMLLIILCHIIKYFTFIPLHSVLGQVFNVGVELFIWISAYLYGSKIIVDWGGFFKKRFINVVLPVQILAIIVFLIYAIYDRDYSHWKDLLPFLFNLQGIQRIFGFIFPHFHIGLGLGHTWFLTVIMFCYMMIPLLQYIKQYCSPKKQCIYLCFLWCTAAISPFINIKIYYFSLYATGYFMASNNVFAKLNLRKYGIQTCICVIALIVREILHRAMDETVLYNNLYVSFCMSYFAIWIAFTIFYIVTLQNKFF